ncbi:MAG: arginine decarboxylase, partial [Planctomycetes bacterium]|nr:arginine decarboxylase [Planctomycetota bacterium]
MDKWTVHDADELYNISRWGEGFFSINSDGHVIAHPKGQGKGDIDLKYLIEDLEDRGIALPVLLRFSDILARRIEDVSLAFAGAIKEYDYKGSYQSVVPIKVNQQKHVVEELITSGRPYHLGLEAGSKPELLAAIGMIDDPQAIIVCNGYKDFEYLETALLSCKIGLRTIIICDRFQEIVDLVRLKNERNLVGPIGVRCKLA